MVTTYRLFHEVAIEKCLLNIRLIWSSSKL